MENDSNQPKNPNRWNKEVRAPFKKVIAWDVLFFILGIGVGLGIGAYLATY
ncbi:MAG: hypothetical protein ACT4NT_07935 [Nitrososphaerota archaeon]